VFHFKPEAHLPSAAPPMMAHAADEAQVPLNVDEDEATQEVFCMNVNVIRMEFMALDQLLSNKQLFLTLLFSKGL
jgi:hypothetical protein